MKPKRLITWRVFNPHMIQKGFGVIRNITHFSKVPNNFSEKSRKYNECVFNIRAPMFSMSISLCTYVRRHAAKLMSKNFSSYYFGQIFVIIWGAMFSDTNLSRTLVHTGFNYMYNEQYTHFFSTLMNNTH